MKGLTQTGLKRRTLLSYGSLALPLALAEIPILLYVPAFYARERHLLPGVVGLVFLCARLWDGLSDLLIGWLSDISRSHWGRRKPWVTAAVPFLIGAFWFLCNPPREAGWLYLAVWMALFYPAWTAMKIPLISWGAELATDYVDRSRVTAFREAFTMLGNLLFALMPVVLLAAAAPLHQVLVLLSTAVALLLPLSALALVWFVPDAVPIGRERIQFLEGFRAIINDPVMVRFAAAILLSSVSEGVINSLAVFSFTIGLQLPDKLFWSTLIFYLAMLGAVPFTLRLARRWEKHWLLTGGIALYAGITLLLLLTPPGHFIPVAAVWILAGMAYASILVLPTSMLADIVDRGEANTGERRSGGYAAIYYLVIKVGLALGVGLAFGLLQLIHFDPSAATHSTSETWIIRLLGFGVPSLLYGAVIPLYLKYPITRAVQRQLRLQINARMGGNATPVAASGDLSRT